MCSSSVDQQVFLAKNGWFHAPTAAEPYIFYTKREEFLNLFNFLCALLRLMSDKVFIQQIFYKNIKIFFVSWSVFIYYDNQWFYIFEN